ncbi:kinase-like protein [Neocallimastix californiae]|uniref:Kinase-like protein n=1 Tax=Neocallimastix californiae TaxID=1754190 RepID=A0A1Y2CYU3_9FUNG|nr:kinase-like protein [Neocallimastix californiae]|eukprot:ORY52211.1 kinase-like protein [Neocallimastix californiae]
MAMPERKLSISDYQILDTIGKGSCGFVKLAKRKFDGKNVIIKYVVKSLVLDGCWTREDGVKIPTEIHILKYITENYPHPYVLRLLNTWEDNYYYYLEFESQNVIDLFECIDNRRFTTEAQVKKIFYRIVQGVQHLHHINIVHRDIKDENILIRIDDDTVEIIDFGSSAYVKEGKKFDKFCGTGGYAAPEVLSGQKYDGPPQDIWSLGILLYTMIYGSNPFRTLDQIITSEVKFPVIVSSGSHDLMCRMLNRDYKKRPTIDEVINHPWFGDLSEEDKQIPKHRQIHIENENNKEENENNKEENENKKNKEENENKENENKNNKENVNNSINDNDNKENINKNIKEKDNHRIEKVEIIRKEEVNQISSNNNNNNNNNKENSNSLKKNENSNTIKINHEDANNNNNNNNKENNNSLKKNENSNTIKINHEDEDETEMDNLSVEILTPLENEKEIEFIKSEEDENELTSTTLNEEIGKQSDIHSVALEECECDIRSDSTLVD